MSGHRIKGLPGGRNLLAPDGAVLAEVLRDAGFPLSVDCRLRGICGKCRIEVAAGDAGDPDASERAVLARRGAAAASRLACRVRVRGPLTIRVPRESLQASLPAPAGGPRREIAVDPPLKKIPLRLPAASLADPKAAADLLLSRFSRPRPSVSTAALKALAAPSPAGGADVTALLYDGAEILDVEPGDTAARSFGAAVDLGTTTVAAELVDLNSGRTVAGAAALNGQARFGADVVSRISAAHLDPSRLPAIRAAAVESVNGLLRELARAGGVGTGEIGEVVIAGNTAMSHLFLGLPVGTLAVAPFQALFSALAPLPAGETGLEMNPAGRVYLAPNIKSFVGGDISAGLIAVDVERAPEKTLFLDLGTNGEIVLKKGKVILATSTAAGPAFEGMGLSCGMLAGPGAVIKAEWRPAPPGSRDSPARGGRLRLRVAGGGEPRGICGSGIIDILAVALERGWLEPDGRIVQPAREIVLSPSLRVVQKDVREIQLAAAAVKTGVRMLLDEAGLRAADLDLVLVAGAFGSTLDVGNAARLGLIPALAGRKVRFAGNASLAGARILLLSAPERRRGEALARRVRHVSLARGEAFQRTFVDALEFKSWR